MIPIGVVRGAETQAIQACLDRFAERHRARLRIAGVIEVFGPADASGGCKASHLRTVSGETYPLFQDLGRDAAACALLPEGVVSASEAVRRDIEAGCDLVVLSKFGKLEAETGSGLVPAFAAALEAGCPILTAVSPRFDAEWRAFATPLYALLPCDDAALDQWIDGIGIGAGEKTDG